MGEEDLRIPTLPFTVYHWFEVEIPVGPEFLPAVT